jgi:caffeoyl-CoA O-methyltransferase
VGIDKFTALTPELHRYAVEHSSFRGGVTPAIEQAGAEMGSLARMQIAGDQAAFMTILVRAIAARRALEVGTFLGYGAVAIARGLPDHGELVVCELEQDYADRALEHLERAGLADRVEIRVGPATETLAAMDEDGSFDLAFIDADKQTYPTYYEHCLRLLRPGGLLLLDNVFMGGRILDPSSDEQTGIVAGLNDRIACDDRVEAAMLAIADGITLVRKLQPPMAA